MHWITYEYKGTQQLGALLPNGTEIASLSDLGIERSFHNMIDFISSVTEEELQRAEQLWKKATSGSLSLEEVRLLAPISRPIHDILCVGINYRAHQEETEDFFRLQDKKEEQHIYFSKRACRISGPEEEISSYPELDPCMDYEAELAVIIGKEGRNISPEQAEDYIFGYSVFNDITARAIQKKHIQWLRGKSLDGYAVMGPAIVHKSQLPFPLELDLSCYVNGELRQQSNTRLLIANLPTIISELSQCMTLEPGDIIATGTPAGVGMSFDPPRFLKSGDAVLCKIESVGQLHNRIK